MAGVTRRRLRVAVFIWWSRKPASALYEELGITSGDLKQLPSRILGIRLPRSTSCQNKDVGASIASAATRWIPWWSFRARWGRSANCQRISDDLVARAADVMLKEGENLFCGVRDTPVNRIHLENMLRAQQAGAVIMPAVPAFYHRPKTIDDL